MLTREMTTDHSFYYMEADIPAGLTLAEYRRGRSAAKTGTVRAFVRRFGVGRR